MDDHPFGGCKWAGLAWKASSRHFGVLVWRDLVLLWGVAACHAGILGFPGRSKALHLPTFKPYTHLNHTFRILDLTSLSLGDIR